MSGPMGSTGQDEGEKGGLTPSQLGILQLNNLTFKLEPDMAVVIQRNVQSSFFQSTAYTAGATMTAVCNTGSAFVNLRQSALVLDVLLTDAASGVWFGTHGGSAANLINRIQIIAKNGVVLERIDNANQLAACKVNYQFSESWKNSVGSLMGIADTSAQLGWLSGNTKAQLQRFVIPLYVFSTLCESIGSLCPSQLLAGARIEILLESSANALIGAVGEIPVYAISACRLEFESYLLTDSVMKVIQQTAASQGLEVIGATTQNTQSQRVGDQIVVDVAKSCSRALSVIYKERPPVGAAAKANGYASFPQFDPMASAVITDAANSLVYVNIPQEWSVRAGQLYFPQSSLRSASAHVGQSDNELYMQTLRAFQKFNPGTMGQNASANTSIYEFRGTPAQGLNLGAQGVAGGNACFALDLQRSAILTSGIPLSNSHQLSITYKTSNTFVASNTFNYLVDVYLTYQVCIRTFLSQCAIEV